MPNLKFNQLLVLSDTLKAANQFEFSKTLNLITAKDNTVGKSTVVKLLFWTLGCEPTFDTTWKNCDCKCLVSFDIENVSYSVFRYKNIVAIKAESGTWSKYNKITGEFSELIADLVGFKVLLPNRNTGKLEVPPPAYYLLPFYIDQKRSWGKAWDNFENLEQYANWKSKVIEYHVGLLKPAHFQIEKLVQLESDKKKLKEEHVARYDTALAVVNEYIPQTNATLNENELTEITNALKRDLHDLTNSQEDLFEHIATLESEKTFLSQQAIISERIIKELEADYTFTIENIDADEIECPLCGVVHENTIVNRASILSDKNQAVNQLENIQQMMGAIESRLENAHADLNSIKERIKNINEKYSKDNPSNTQIEVENIVDSYAAKAIQIKVGAKREADIVEIDSIKSRIKDSKKQQRELTTNGEKESIGNTFFDFFSAYINLLGAEGVNLAEINKPTDYAKIQREGGAAEGTRGMLAYYLAVFSCIVNRDIEVVSPLVVDTPNQHEQSDVNYEKIVKLLVTKIKTEQVFLCAMENDKLKDYREKAKIIELTKSKILQPELYDNVKIVGLSGFTKGF